MAVVFSGLKMLIGLSQGERGGTLSTGERERDTDKKKINKDDGDDGDPLKEEKEGRGMK